MPGEPQQEKPAAQASLRALFFGCGAAAAAGLLIAAGTLLKEPVLSSLGLSPAENEMSLSSDELAMPSKAQPGASAKALTLEDYARSALEAGAPKPQLKPGISKAGTGPTPVRTWLPPRPKSSQRTQASVRKPPDVSASGSLPNRRQAAPAARRPSPARAVFNQASCHVHAGRLSGVNVSTSYKYYAIHGSDRQQLAEQIEKLGPYNPALGRNSMGKTDSDIRSPYVFAPGPDGQCRLTSFSVNLNVVITLPRWDRRGPAELRAQWDKALRTVQAHEESHKAIAIQSANEIHRALERFGAGPCDDFEASLKDMLHTHYSALEQKQYDFDKIVYQRPECHPQI
ncbi:MAG: DUF922 domain-containing protein [Elusimicrobia bacterium]|nr:DUF922 domain-containing protein [Elusimicrobiota bacterium]